MSFSPPKGRKTADNFFSEIGDVLDKKSSNYLASWDPQSLLNPQQKENIERSRNDASMSIVLANKALSGVLDYSDWKQSSSSLLKDAPPSSSAGFQRHEPLSLPLQPPPPLVPALLKDYVSVVLGVGQLDGYVIPGLCADDASIAAYAQQLPQSVALEALAENMGAGEGGASSKSLIVSAVCELEEIYNEMRIAIAPKAGDAMRINVSHDEILEVGQLVVRNALTKVETVVNGSLLRAIGTEI